MNKKPKEYKLEKEEGRYIVFADKLIEEHENNPDEIDFNEFVKELKIIDEDLKK